MRNKFLPPLNHYHKLSLLFFITIFFWSTLPKNTLSYSYVTVDPYNTVITINFPLKNKDFIYHDFFIFSASHHAIVLSAWKTNHKPIAHYDLLFKNTKLIYNKSFSLSIQATATSQPYNDSTYLYCTYYQHSKKKLKNF